MIKYITSFLNKEEIQYFIEIFQNENTIYHNDKVYKFYYVDLIDWELKVQKFLDFNFKNIQK